MLCKPQDSHNPWLYLRGRVKGHYSLCPLQAPYDIRLIDGQTYRVVWIGASGEVIPPKPDGTIPGLHFFLTSCAEPVGVEAESGSGESRHAHHPTETERLTKALATAIPAIEELLASLTALAKEQSSADKAVAEESISPTQEESAPSAESVASSQSVVASESPSQKGTSSDGMGVPPNAIPELGIRNRLAA